MPSTPVAPTPLTAQQAAQALYNQGLFSGTGKDANGNPNFDLDRAPTRHEAVTMLVRLLGKANEAESGTWNTPFTDVAEWEKPYVGYAYTNGLTSGTLATTYGGNQIVTASQYLTFVLRALGYQVGTDFLCDKAWELSDRIGLTNGQYNASMENFTRGDVAIISNNALKIPYRNGNKTLEDELFGSSNINIQPTQPSNPAPGSFAHEKVFCKRGGDSMVWLQNAEVVQWRSCCPEVLIISSDKHTCDIYVLSTASTRKHHFIECTDTSGFKYICIVDVFLRPGRKFCVKGDKL